MKIDVAPNDYRRLLMMLYITDWILNAHEVDVPAGFRRKCGDTVGRFLEHADRMGCGDLIDDYQDGVLELGDSLESEPAVREAIASYDSQTLWTDLVGLLAERDYEKLHGRPAVPYETDPDIEETEEELGARLEEIDRLEQVYWEEFEANGIENLHLLPGLGRPS